MAEILDKIKQRFDKGVATLNVRSKELIETQKLKGQVGNLLEEKENKLKELGQYIYSEHAPAKQSSTIAGKKSGHTPPSYSSDPLQNALLSVLKSALSGELKGVEMGKNKKTLTLSSSVIYNETIGLLPKSKQKDLSTRKLGLMLSKLGVVTDKSSRTVEGSRETLYSFDTKKTGSLLAKSEGPKPHRPTASNKTGNKNSDDLILKRCREITAIDEKINKLNQQIKEIKLNAKKKSVEK